VVKLNSANDPARQLLARALEAAGRWEEAVTVLQAAGSPWCSFDLGNIYRAHGKPEEATRAFRAALKSLALVPEVWLGLTESLLDQGNFAEARTTIETHLAQPMSEAYRRAQRHRLELCNVMLSMEPNLPAILGNRRANLDQIGIENWTTVSQSSARGVEASVRGEGCVRWTTLHRSGSCTLTN
jgi:tetratricopeptide (TPR) repeat protein